MRGARVLTQAQLQPWKGGRWDSPLILYNQSCTYYRLGTAGSGEKLVTNQKSSRNSTLPISFALLNPVFPISFHFSDDHCRDAGVGRWGLWLLLESSTLVTRWNQVWAILQQAVPDGLILQLRLQSMIGVSRCHRNDAHSCLWAEI